MVVPTDKVAFLSEAEEQVREIQEQYQEGLITDGERYNKVVDIWSKATEQVTEQMLDTIAVDHVLDAEGNAIEVPSFNSI